MRGTYIPIRHKWRFGQLTAQLQDELNSLFKDVLSDAELGNKNPRLRLAEDGRFR